MYGRTVRMRPVAGKERDVIEILGEGDRERRPNVKGVLGGYFMKPDSNSGEQIGIAVFEDREAFLANRNDPQQDVWFRKLRGLLQLDPDQT